MQLNDFGVTEMSETEMQSVDGGIIPAIIVGVVLLLWSSPAK